MPIQRALSVFGMLLCLSVAAPAEPQGFGDRIERPKQPERFDTASHQPGSDVVLPPLDELRLVGQFGETLVLSYDRTIPSQRRALSSVQILYRYKIGDATAHVIHRQISTGRFDMVPLGPDGVAAIHNGYQLIPASIEAPKQHKGFVPHEVNGFGALRQQFKDNQRELMRYPNATPRGVIYQEAIKVDGRLTFGPIYYAPRDKLTYNIEKEVLVAETGFAEIGLQRQFNTGLRQGERYVVLFNKDQTKASVLDVESLDHRVIDIVAPKGSDKWHMSSTMMDDRYLYASHGLYDLKTGERVAVREKNPGKTRTYHRPTLMHNRVSYGLTHTTQRDENGTITANGYTLWARPVLDDGGRQRVLVTNKNDQYGGAPFAGENGLFYTDGKRWIKMDWLSPDDFEANEAKD